MIEEDFDNEIFHNNCLVNRSNYQKINYIDQLLTLNINVNIIEWIKINLSNVKIGRISNEELCSLIFLAHAELKIECNHDYFLKLLNAKHQIVATYLSGTNSSQSILTNINITIPISVINPIIYISDLTLKICEEYKIDNVNTHIMKQ